MMWVQPWWWLLLSIPPGWILVRPIKRHAKEAARVLSWHPVSNHAPSWMDFAEKISTHIGTNLGGNIVFAFVLLFLFLLLPLLFLYRLLLLPVAALVTTVSTAAVDMLFSPFATRFGFVVVFISMVDGLLVFC